ncbi:TPA: hypothetical protein DEO28_00620 [Candidatus Dependentiae bacterium]|nr:MAG: Major sperm protein [candidate division TM6 bacterium GW2011_GWE2_31_21]KKP54095.1 MAG: Major sperm protein [candidate division TM6 bacterium GW2011_GWF2_33_332]HBS48323.1 hypothetical protein [Candidatus Dependentiae bacterium]HBZ73003.1 hypothetical protein [Candidatus Dependentiae bacterium]
MKSKMQITSKILVGGLILTALTGCGGLFKKDKEEGAALITINGEAVLKQGEFNKYLEQFLQLPQLRGAMTIETMPEVMKKNILQSLVDQKVVLYWAKKNSVEGNAEFKKNLNDLIKLVTDQSMIKFFEKDTFDNIKISEDDSKAEFEKNKKRFVKAEGGVAVVGISFEKPMDATAFMSRIKGKEANFEVIAKETKSGVFRNFGRVEKDSNIPGMPNMNSVLAAATFPTIKMVKDGRLTWVICGIDKKEAEYRTFEEAKKEIEDQLKMQKFGVEFKNRIDGLKKEYKIELNEAALAPKKEEPKAEESKKLAENETPKCACDECGEKHAEEMKKEEPKTEEAATEAEHKEEDKD